MRKPVKQLAVIMLSLLLALSAAAQNFPNIVDLVEENSEPVVSVRVKSEPKGNAAPRGIPREFLPFSPPELLPFFHGRPGGRHPVTSIGSGFIIDAEGYVLTNAHVVEGGDEIIVALKNGDEYTAKLVGRDKKTDVALLKIEADKPLPTVKIGDSQKLRVGQWVVAIGSPWGLDQTVTAGIISALGRRLPQENYVPFIQTDAAVNPGNSGGPLMDLEGRVIGINSQIISPVKAYAGLSFAIPINVVMDIQRKLRDDGFVRRAQLGVIFSRVSKTIAEAMGLDRQRGALIQDVLENSAAAEAGLQSGDILLSFNGMDIEKSHQLPLFIGSVLPGTKATFEVLRNGNIITVTAVLGALEDDVIILGMRLKDLDDNIRNRLQVEGDFQGIVIVGIENNEKTPENIDQLRPDDIITDMIIQKHIHPIHDIAALQKILNDADNASAVAFRVWRKGRRLVIAVELNN